MTARILITGAQGQLGYSLHQVLAPLGEVRACDRSTLDLTQASQIARVCAQFQPHWIINAAAYTAVDQAEDHSDLAYAINRDALAHLASAAKKCAASIIHYSTDYVFDGTLDRPYREDDSTAPMSVYGQSKCAGEEILCNSGVPYLIFRTSWMFALQGQNFAHTIYRLAKSGKALAIINDQIGAPTSVDFLAQLTASIITRYGELGDQKKSNQGLVLPSGIYHATCSGQTSWHGYADYLLEATGLHEARAALRAIPSADYPQRAYRPKNSRLSGQKLADTFGIVAPPWQFYVARWAQALRSNLA